MKSSTCMFIIFLAMCFRYAVLEGKEEALNYDPILPVVILAIACVYFMNKEKGEKK